MTSDRFHWAAIVVMLSAAAPVVWGQLNGDPPFFSAGATAYEAQISTAEVGTPLSARVTVSADRKYANMGAQASNLGAVNFTPFAITMPAGGGFVGSGSGSTIGSPAAGTSILDRPGMTLVAPAQP
jgi:hypothetical protein